MGGGANLLFISRKEEMRHIKLIWGDKIVLESKEEYHKRLKKRHEEIRTREVADQ